MLAAADPTPDSLVADEFLSYLQTRKGLEGISYLRPPAPVPDGWETYTYRLQLDGRDRLPAALSRPLALRVYAGHEGLPRLRREWAVQRRLAALDYPVAQPLLKEENPEFLGGPFLLMEWVEGDAMLERLLRDYFALLWAPWRMAEVHVRLHQLPMDGLPAPDRPLIDRELETLQAAVDEHGLTGLAPGVAWLRAHRPRETAPLSLLHLDFHAKNLLVRDGGVSAVLDWSESDVGDRHADVGAALLLIDAAPIEKATWWDRLMLPIGRFLTHHFYLYAYSRRLTLDPIRLRYYQAWAAMRRLSWYARWLCDGPCCMGYKPGAERHVRPDHVADLERYFQRRSGVAVRLGLPLGERRGLTPQSSILTG